MMKYRLLVKQGRKWIIGIAQYATILEAQTRQLELELLGIKTKVCDSIGTEVIL